MKFNMFLKEVRKLEIPLKKYAILGSGPLAVRGIRETKDIDLIVTPDVYEYYKKQKGWKRKFAYTSFFLRKGHIEMWKNINFLRCRANISEFIERAELIDGLPFVNLLDFITWKKKGYRKKDGKDVLLAQIFLLSRDKSLKK